MSMPQEKPELIGGRYHLLRQIGAGGTSTVYEAIHHLTQEKVAIKLIPLKQLKSDTRTVARFMREAKLSQEVQHPGIVRVTDAWIEEQKHCCLVMERLNGVSLREAIQSAELSRLQILNWIIKSLDALEVAHRAGIIHRDLKPENIFIHMPAPAENDTMVSSEQYYFDESSGQLKPLEAEGVEFNEQFETQSTTVTHLNIARIASEYSSLLQVKILDFGLSRTIIEPSVTQTGHFVGTPWYMSPEQVFSPKNCTHQTDIWSVGIMLFEAIFNQVPFKGNSVPEVCLAIKEQQVDLDDHKESWPAAKHLFSIIENCLEKDLSQRVSSAANLKYELENIIQNFAQTKLADEVVVGEMYLTPVTQTASFSKTAQNFGQEIEFTDPIEQIVASLPDEERNEPATLKLTSDAIQIAMQELRNMAPQQKEDHDDKFITKEILRDDSSELGEPEELELDADWDRKSEISELPTLMTKAKSPFYQPTNPSEELKSNQINASVSALNSDHASLTKETNSDQHSLAASSSLKQNQMLNDEEYFIEFKTEHLRAPLPRPKNNNEFWLIVILFITGIGVGWLLKLFKFL